MKKNITFESYAYTKNVIYQLYPALRKLSEDDLEKIFSTFGKLENVARNTYLFPYDLDLFNEVKDMEQGILLDTDLQTRYNIDSKLLTEKYVEYKFYNFNKLLNEAELLELDSLKKFHYQDDNGQKRV